jgi:hypothetical protein
MRTIRLNDEERLVLANALDLYIRVGLGQFTEIAQRLDMIHGMRLETDQRARVAHLCGEIENVLWDDQAPWRLEDTETSLHTLVAFLLDGRLHGNAKQVQWAERRCTQRRLTERIEERER